MRSVEKPFLVGPKMQKLAQHPTVECCYLRNQHDVLWKGQLHLPSHTTSPHLLPLSVLCKYPPTGAVTFSSHSAAETRHRTLSLWSSLPPPPSSLRLWRALARIQGHLIIPGYDPSRAILDHVVQTSKRCLNRAPWIKRGEDGLQGKAGVKIKQVFFSVSQTRGS